MSSKKIIISGLLSLMAFAVLFTSCDRKHPGFKKTKSGLYYKIHLNNPEGRTIDTGSVVTLHLSYRTPSDSVFSSTYDRGPIILDQKASEYPGDIYEGLSLLHEGDSATFVLGSDSFFVKTAGTVRPFFLDSAGFFYLDVKIEKVQSGEEYDAALESEKIAKRAMEAEELQAFLSDNNITQQPTPSGLVFVEKKAGKGKAPGLGNILKLHYTVKLITGTVLFDSKAQNDPMVHQIGSGRSGQGFDEGLSLMREGGEAMMVIPSKIAFGEDGYQAIPPFATVIFDVQLIKVFTEEEYEKEQLKEASDLEMKEKSDLSAFLKKEKISAKPSASGLYYVELQAGTGKKAVAGKRVKVHYDGKLLNGQRFDSSIERGEPFEFTLGKNEVIKGWDEGVAMMKVGGKAKLIIPSALAYGVQGAGNRIPPYSTLVFEVELLDTE